MNSTSETPADTTPEDCPIVATPQPHELWAEHEIPFEVAERIVKARMAKEVEALGWLDDLSLKAEKREQEPGAAIEFKYGFWINCSREWANTIEEARKSVKTPEQIAADKLADAKRKLAEAESEVAKLQPAKPAPFRESECGGVLGADGNVYSDADQGL